MMGGNQSTPNYNDPKYDRNYVHGGGGGAPAYNPNYDANRGPIQGTPNYPSGNPYQASAHGTYNNNGGNQGTYNTTPAYGGNNGSNQGTMNEGGYGPSYAGTGNYAPSGPGQNPWNSGTANAVPGSYNNNNNTGNYGGAPAFNPNGDNNGNRNW